MIVLRQSGAPRHGTSAAALAAALDAALGEGSDEALAGVRETEPADRRDRALALSMIHDLHLAPVDGLGARAWLQHHPVIADLKWRLERSFLDDVTVSVVADTEDAVAGMRRIASRDLVPHLYDWLAEEASFSEVAAYVALEGGPDGGFDDLVALCQVGIDGEPKLELATNYWDEMGRGAAADVHTELHRTMVHAMGIYAVDREAQPVEALERALLSTTLATNRALQPELIGALGLIELQAGPRCRRMVRALERVGAPAEAVPFYAEHAEADPRHGKDWLDRVVGPLAARHATWGARMVQGAVWRSTVNARFFEASARLLGIAAPARSGERADSEGEAARRTA